MKTGGNLTLQIEGACNSRSDYLMTYLLEESEDWIIKSFDDSFPYQNLTIDFSNLEFEGEVYMY